MSVSKGGREHYVCCPSFETAAAQPPQDEGVVRQKARREEKVDGRILTSQFSVAGDSQRERIEMKLKPASGLEPGALATTMDIVIA